MLCPKCKVEMIKSSAIDPKYDERALYIVPVGNLKAKDLHTRNPAATWAIIA